jgi:hypothetical protein
MNMYISVLPVMISPDGSIACSRISSYSWTTLWLIIRPTLTLRKKTTKWPFTVALLLACVFPRIPPGLTSNQCIHLCSLDSSDSTKFLLGTIGDSTTNLGCKLLSSGDSLLFLRRALGCVERGTSPQPSNSQYFYTTRGGGYPTGRCRSASSVVPTPLPSE